MHKKHIFSYKTLASILSGVGFIVVTILNEFNIFFNNDIVVNIISAILGVLVGTGFVSKPAKEDKIEEVKPEINENKNLDTNTKNDIKNDENIEK